MKSKLLFPLVLLFLLSAQLRLQAQCNPDLTPPIAVCNADVFVSLASSGTTGVSVSAFDAGSWDACCFDKVEARRFVDGPCDADNLPDDFDSTVVFCCADIGATVIVMVRATDCSGNFNECWTEVTVEDKIKPAVQCPPNVTVSCESFDTTLISYGLASVVDNCCLDTTLKSVNYSQFDTVCSKGTIVRTFEATDCNGNTSQCTHRIEVTHDQNYFVRFPDDVIVTDGSTDYDEPEFFGNDCEQLEIAYSDLVFTSLPGADVRIERTWQIINWCKFDLAPDLVVVPNPQPETDEDNQANLPGPIVSASGTLPPWAPTVVSILPGQSPTDYSTFYAPNTFGYQYKQVIKIVFPDPATVTGKVFLDTLDNCTYDNGESLLANWPVKITGLVTGNVYEVLTDNLGEYNKEFDPTDTLVEVTLAVPFNFGQNCPTVYTLNVASGQTATQDIPAHLEADCPLLSVDISAPFLRRCFPNTYTVQACNLSSTTVEDAFAAVALDSYIEFDTSSIPGTFLGNNVYGFELGDLDAGECVSFQIFFDVSCDAPLGYTHCTEARIFPDTICNTSDNWSGADLKVTGVCDGDSVRMTIINIGAGDMTQMQDFVVVEDVVMYMAVPFQLNSGASVDFLVPANGATWRVETDEVAYHPWGGVEAKAVEGCGGLNETGLVTMFSFNTPNPFEAVDCQENIGAYDPNDKQAFPKGYGVSHFVEANTDIEYHIRFQNTGTDTAFTVVVLDTLSQHLDAASVRPGASSHDYDFALLDGNVLRFKFDNILLPDSNVNEAASHGFVKFRIPQKADNPDGTLIENSAAIYFDFNEPIITNTTFHTIGDHFVLVKNDEPAAGVLKVYPNPSIGTVVFELPETMQQGRFELTNNLGQMLRNERISGNQYRFERGLLSAGIYFYKISDGAGQIFTGKILLK
jgi:uncharacterized repeat protein (TIGR01451 family)